MITCCVGRIHEKFFLISPWSKLIGRFNSDEDESLNHVKTGIFIVLTKNVIHLETEVLHLRLSVAARGG